MYIMYFYYCKLSQFIKKSLNLKLINEKKLFKFTYAIVTEQEHKSNKIKVKHKEMNEKTQLTKQNKHAALKQAKQKAQHKPSHRALNKLQHPGGFSLL